MSIKFNPLTGNLDLVGEGGGGSTAGLVPYTGATQDVDLGSYDLNVSQTITANSVANGLVLRGRDAPSGDTDGGGINLVAGTASGVGVGGAIGITGGAAFSGSNSDGGGVYISPGAGDGSGDDGPIVVYNTRNAHQAHLDFTSTGSRNYAFPDASGTLALLSDIPGAGVTGGTITRTSGLITSVALTGGDTFTITRDSDDLIEEITDGTKTWTFSRTAGQIVSWTIT